jgi:hypothetical protein
MERDDDGAYHGRGGEKHGQHEETAAQEHRCKKSIFARAEPVTQRPDKPKECDAGKGHQIQRDNHRAYAALEPCTGLVGISRYRKPHQPENGQQQH